jgi:hypothetical protein
MSPSRRTTLLRLSLYACFTLLAAAFDAPAQYPLPPGWGACSTYYSPWYCDHLKEGYVCCLWYKATPSDTQYDWHYCYYFPKKAPGKVYFSDRVTGQFWGCYDFTAGGFRLLDPMNRARNWESIPATAYSRPQPRAQLPRSVGDNKVTLPPDLPSPG